MIYYHGTSYENYKAMKDGNTKILKNYKESEEDKMYFYDESGLDNAYKAAVTCAAITNSQAPIVIILKVDLDESKMEIDNSDGLENIFGSCRTCIDYSDFNIEQAEIIPFLYYPKKRAKYLYNHYHSTCCLNWNSIKDYVVDRDNIEKECDLIYKEIKEYEYHFEEISFEYSMKKLVKIVKNSIEIFVNFMDFIQNVKGELIQCLNDIEDMKRQ